MSSLTPSVVSPQTLPYCPFSALLPEDVALVVLRGDGHVLVLGAPRPVRVLDVVA